MQGIPSPAAPGILVTHHMIQPLGFPGKSGFPPGWSEKLSNLTLPLKIGFSRPGTPRNRFVLKFCVVWYLQNRIWLEKCLKSATFDFWPSGVRYLSAEISIRNGSYFQEEESPESTQGRNAHRTQMGTVGQKRNMAGFLQISNQS